MKDLDFRNSKVLLRKFKRSDCKALSSQFKDSKANKYLPFMKEIGEESQARLWINFVHKLFREKQAYYYGIEMKDSGELIGAMNLKNVNMSDRNAEVEYWVNKDYWRRGYASDSLSILLAQAFGTLDLVRVYAIVHAKNIASIKLLEKFGFIREGVWRKASFLDNEWSDVYGYGLLKQEYQELKGW